LRLKDWKESATVKIVRHAADYLSASKQYSVMKRIAMRLGGPVLSLFYSDMLLKSKEISINRAFKPTCFIREGSV